MNKIQVFISYSHKDREIADIIQRDFLPIDSITLIQDVRDMGYKGSIKEFMKRVRDTDFVLMLISDHFIKSPNCMYEVMELLESSDFEKRLLPIQVSNNGQHADIFSFDGRAGYIRFWEDKLHESSEKIKEHRSLDNLESLTSDLKHYRNIRSNIGQFFNVLSDWNIARFEELRHESYRSILNFIGVKEVNQIEDVLRIQSIHDPEEQEIALQNLLKKNPDNKGALLIKAFTAFEKQQYKIAAYYYSQLLEKDPNHEGANLNSALCHFYLDDDKRAGEFVQQTLLINPDNVSAHLCQAELHARNGNEQGAEKHYHRAVQLAPDLFEAHFNYASFLLHQKNDLNNALAQYSEAERLQPEHQETLIRLADTHAKLGNHHQSYETCRQLLTLWPHNAWAQQMVTYLQSVLDGYSRVEGENKDQIIDSMVSDAYKVSKSRLFTEAKFEFNQNLCYVVRSPVVGTFYVNNNIQIYNDGGYYSSSYSVIDRTHEKGPFVKIGDKVSSGDHLCVIQLMSTYIEVETEHRGIIVRRFVENGEPVEFDQPIFEVFIDFQNVFATQGGYFFRGPIILGIEVLYSSTYNGPIKDGYDYSRAKTEGAFFVDLGDWVEKGQALCKIRNDESSMVISSPRAGFISEIFIQDGKPVRENQPLFEISSYKPPA